MKFRISFAWLKDRWAGWVVGTIAGFVAGLLLFYAPWHLRPAYGDLATWLLVVVGAIGGFAALRQLGILQRQVGDEAERNVKRDELLDRQLAEVAARAATEQRRQAEDVEMARRSVQAFVGRGEYPATPAYVEAYVINNSRRPITGIVCKLMSRTDGGFLRDADEGGAAIDIRSGPDEPANWVAPRRGSVTRCDVLAPGAGWGFRFRDLVLGDDQIVAAWFRDDAKVPWRLDEMQHLVQTADEDRYQR